MTTQTWDQTAFPRGGNENYDQFGQVLAAGNFNGDRYGYGDLAIGTPLEDFVQVNRGKVNTLYGGSSGLTSSGSQVWNQDDVPGSPPENYDQFGASLTSGDFDGDGYDDLLIGVPFEDLGTVTNSGIIHALYGSSSGLTSTGSQFFTQTSFPQGANEAFDQFGQVLAAGDFDGDGYDDAAIGTPYEDSTLSNIGKVNILHGSFTGLTATGSELWTQDDLNGTPEEAGDLFGASLTSGDFDGDGYDDLAVGATGEDWGSIVDTGVVHAVYGSNTGLTRTGSQVFTQTGLPQGSNENYDHFGEVLASGDFDGDGYDDLAVGTPDEDINGSSIVNAGKVNILHGSSTGLTTVGSQLWTQNNLTGTNAEAYDSFGASLAVGDFDGDGYDDLVVGSPYEDWGGTQDAGIIHAIYGSNSGLRAVGNQIWTQANFSGQTIEAFDRFGASLASHDFNGDGYDDVAIGVPGEDFSGLTNTGIVHIIYGSDDGLVV